ncbi:hypothetical protein HYT01_02815 [Candidatus Giovannonibacteria bacterium]|nr:hypothetical protein [Candidatus Giovannonibacteria bacterium]
MAYQATVVAFPCGAEVEVVIPEANRKYSPPEMELEGKKAVVLSKPYSNRTVDISIEGKQHNVPAAYLRRK